MNIQKPNHIKHSYTQTIIAGPEKVFPLLCPVLEAEWVPGWNPELVISNSGVAEKDCVFITPASPQNAIWVVTHHDPQNYTVEMLKITPGHTVCKLEIALHSDKSEETKAEVAYTYTSLGPEGDAFLKEFTVDWYRNFMENWERAMNHYLSTGEMIAGE